MNNLNNIQKAMDNKGELARVPFLTYEERQAVKLEQTLLYHVKQLALYCNGSKCNKCTLKNIIECDGRMKEVNGRQFKDCGRITAPPDWMYYINKSGVQTYERKER